MNQQSTTHINLIRHGETDWNVEHRYQGSTDIPLNDLGRKQVKWLADSMRDESWDVIYSSPSMRAFDTAKAVAAAIGIDEEAIIRDRRLMERGYGEAEGLTLPEREAKWPEGEWPGLESWEEVAERTMKTLHSAVQDNLGKRILIVCHGGVINAILATISEGEIGTGKTVIDNTSRTTLDVTGDIWTIGDVNNIDHLEALAAAD
ncbi:MAG TPA: histidine phosphatase family protein [Thermomicrobiales bacterium]|nr:histidine phosphatase family protein [Thermomicrobiales bacterium]